MPYMDPMGYGSNLGGTMGPSWTIMDHRNAGAGGVPSFAGALAEAFTEGVGVAL